LTETTVEDSDALAGLVRGRRRPLDRDAPLGDEEPRFALAAAPSRRRDDRH
jgi:hypothetical protein